MMLAIVIGWIVVLVLLGNGWLMSQAAAGRGAEAQAGPAMLIAAGCALGVVWLIVTLGWLLWLAI